MLHKGQRRKRTRPSSSHTVSCRLEASRLSCSRRKPRSHPVTGGARQVNHMPDSKPLQYSPQPRRACRFSTDAVLRGYAHPFVCLPKVVLGVGAVALASWAMQALLLPRLRALFDGWSRERREAEEKRQKARGVVCATVFLLEACRAILSIRAIRAIRAIYPGNPISALCLACFARA